MAKGRTRSQEDFRIRCLHVRKLLEKDPNMRHRDMTKAIKAKFGIGVTLRIVSDIQRQMTAPRGQGRAIRKTIASVLLKRKPPASTAEIRAAVKSEIGYKLSVKEVEEFRRELKGDELAAPVRDSKAQTHYQWAKDYLKKHRGAHSAEVTKALCKHFRVLRPYNMTVTHAIKDLGLDLPHRLSVVLSYLKANKGATDAMVQEMHNLLFAKPVEPHHLADIRFKNDLKLPKAFHKPLYETI